MKRNVNSGHTKKINTIVKILKTENQKEIDIILELASIAAKNKNRSDKMIRITRMLAQLESEMKKQVLKNAKIKLKSLF